jgi:hypothetical protein
MPKIDQSYIVHRGDATFYFEFGRLYLLSYLKQIFRKKIQHCSACEHPIELFPGLILRDGEVKLWRP